MPASEWSRARGARVAARASGLAAALTLTLTLTFGGWRGAPTASAFADNPVTPAPKVSLAFNRLYDYPELEEALRALVAAHPKLLTLSSVGKSVEGRDLWCVTINNPETGPDREKPAMYVDGNVHGNEVQASEACLYLIWYLAENYERLEKIRELVDAKAFYVLPTVNPDGRAWWFNGPNTTHSSRSGKAPVDDDRDGLFDEDGYDDLNGDGQITLMRRKSPTGRFKVSPEDPRLLIPVGPGELGEYELLGYEGIDNDGDGEINEDAPGGYDMNRNYPADWQPEHVQRGAGPYPLCWPETRAVAEFVLDHPNIAGVQSFHNNGGMILRGPGHPSREPQYARSDDETMRDIGETGARMMPYYRNWVIHRDLYPVHGGFVTWTYEHLGIFSFTNELWNENEMLNTQNATPADNLFAADNLLHGASYIPWKPFRHPTYGDIEIGGYVKQSQRVPPPFKLEELCHRNASFVILHADQAPVLEWGEVKVERLADDLRSITVAVRNTRKIPTISAQAARRRLSPPDRLTISGENLEVLGGGALVNRDTGKLELAERNPHALRFPSGVAGGSEIAARWFVRGAGEVRIRYRSDKGGSLGRAISLD